MNEPGSQPAREVNLVPLPEVAAQLGVTVRTVRRHIRKGALPSYPISRHENGAVAYGVPRAALETGAGPPAGRRGLPARRRGPGASGPAGIPLTRDGVPDVAACRAAGLSAQVDEWDRRMRIIAEYQAARRRTDISLTAAAEMVAIAHRISVATLYQWRALLVEAGPAALVPHWPTKRGTTLPADLQRQIREFWLDSRRASARQVYRHVVLPYYMDAREDAPHYSTVTRYIRSDILPLEAVARREGPRAYLAEAAPKVRRALPAPGVVWCADHRLCDVLVVVADGQGVGWGKHSTRKCVCGSGRERRNCCSLRRPWATMIADVGSAAWVGWRLGLTPTAAGVCHAIRSAILRFGAPEKWMRDNGREFTARRLGGRAERLRRPRRSELAGSRRWPAAMPEQVETSGIWQVLGTQVITAIPYSAWSKPIESYFAAISRDWENLCPGWTGRSPDGRPEQLDRQVRNGTLLTYEQFSEVFRRQIARWNEEHVCAEREAPPLALYKDVHSRARAPARETLSYLLQDARQARVAQDGITLAAGGRRYRYWSEDLALLVGMTVQVRWDPDEPGEIYAYAPGGEVLAIGRAEDASWDGWGEANVSARRAARAQRQYISARAAEASGSVPEDRLDPTGAVAMIAERTAAVAADARLRETAELAADDHAQQQITAAARAANAGDQQPPGTAYDDLLEGIA